MQRFDLMLEDAERLRFITVRAKDAVEALINAMKETGILNPTHVAQKAETGKYTQFSL